LTSSLIKLLVSSVVLFAVACNSSGDNGIDCASNAIGKDSLVRVHKEQQRFFIQEQQVTHENLRPVIAKISACLKNHEWKEKWSLSVFSDKKLAGYKDEPNIIPFHNNDEWSKGYLAEFDASSHILTLNPVVKPETIEVSP